MCRKSTSPVVTNLYTFRNERSDELGGMAVNKLFQVVCIWLGRLWN